MKPLKPADERETELLDSIHRSDSLRELNGLLKQRDPALVTEVLKKVNFDFLKFLLPKETLREVNEFLCSLMESDYRRAKEFLEAVPVGRWKILIEEAEMRDCNSFFYTVAYKLYAFTFFESIVDFDIISKKRMELHDVVRFYDFLFYTKKFDNNFHVAVDVELLMRSVKNSSKDHIISAIDTAASIGRDFIRTFFEFIPFQCLMEVPYCGLDDIANMLDEIPKVDAGLFKELLIDNQESIKYKMVNYDADNKPHHIRGIIRFFEVLYETGQEYAVLFLDKEFLKKIICSTDYPLDDIAELLLLFFKYDVITANELLQFFFKRPDARRFFDFKEYSSMTGARKRLRYLHLKLEKAHDSKPCSDLARFLFYFVRAQLLDIANEFKSDVKLEFCDFPDTDINEKQDELFDGSSEAQDFLLREIASSSLKEKENVMMETKQYEDEGNELFTNKFSEIYDDLKDKFNKRLIEYKSTDVNDIGNRLIILADLFSAAYATMPTADISNDYLILQIFSISESIDSA